jgi:hypothetical protein
MFHPQNIVVPAHCGRDGYPRISISHILVVRYVIISAFSRKEKTDSISSKMKHNKDINIAIFDLDGTLVDTDASNTAAYKVALRRYGVGDVFTSVLELSSH